MITGAGWISAGPGYRRHLLDDRALVDVSAALSWNLYQVAQGRFELPHLANDRLSLGAQASYQDVLQVDYFGLGNDSLKADRSAYRFNNLDFLGYATVRATSWLSVNGRFGWIPRPDLSTATGRKVTVPEHDRSLFRSLSARDPIAAVISARRRVGRGRLARPPGPSDRRRTLSGLDRELFGSRRGHVQLSALRDRGVAVRAALHEEMDRGAARVGGFFGHVERRCRAVLSHAEPGRYRTRCAGTTTIRFHDNDMQVFNAESRWALFAHVDAAAFVDAGKVAPRAGDLDFRRLKTSYGAGLRVHNSTSTLLRGSTLATALKDGACSSRSPTPFKRSTPASGRSSVVPFVP